MMLNAVTVEKIGFNYQCKPQVFFALFFWGGSASPKPTAKGMVPFKPTAVANVASRGATRRGVGGCAAEASTPSVGAEGSRARAEGAGQLC